LLVAVPIPLRPGPFGLNFPDLPACAPSGAVRFRCVLYVTSILLLFLHASCVLNARDPRTSVIFSLERLSASIKMRAPSFKSSENLSKDAQGMFRFRDPQGVGSLVSGSPSPRPLHHVVPCLSQFRISIFTHPNFPTLASRSRTIKPLTSVSVEGCSFGNELGSRG
jgi:hypothetical protein